MTKSDEHYYHISNSARLRPILKNVFVALGIHWLFQNIWATDHTEQLFKFATDAILTVLFYFVLIQYFSFIAAVILSWSIAHTINFLFNGQIFGVLKNWGNIKHDLDEIEQYINSMKNRIRTEPSLYWAAIYGSLSRGELKSTSDLDVRVIRYPGFINGLKACIFVARERTRAHVKQFPLDILLLDSPRLLKRLRADEPPIVIYDASAAFSKG